MAKDPAFLFYYQDFLVGTDHMTNEQVGAYIRCLCHQANRGSIRPSHMQSLVGSQENMEIVKEKFKKAFNGDFINERLSSEIQRRKDFTASRVANLKGSHKGKHMAKHMETENETILYKGSSFDLKEIIMFFKDMGSTELVAQRFFNHYEGVQWMSGATRITNWKPKAQTWILNEKPAEKQKNSKLKGLPSA